MKQIHEVEIPIMVDIKKEKKKVRVLYIGYYISLFFTKKSYCNSKISNVFYFW